MTAPPPSPASLLDQAVPPRTVPPEVARHIERYQRDFGAALAEPPELHGLVYQMDPDGTITILKRAWETSPEIPPTGPDIPADAVRNNRVFIYVDGIGQSIDNQQDNLRRLFLAPRENPLHGASIDQPAIAIHEAEGPNPAVDGTRIALDLAWLKAVQGGYLPKAWVKQAAFRTDAAVKSVYNEVRQSLAAGRDVQLAMHSGGGAESALALNLLASEDRGRWKNLIRDHVRVFAMAPGASQKDFELAGVKAENIYYTASQEDPVYRLAHKYVAPHQMLLLAGRSALVGLSVLFDRQSLPYHSPDYIFWRNVQPDGTQLIQAYLDGGPGGEHILP